MSYQSPFHMKMRSLTNQKIKDDSKKRNHAQNLGDKVVKQSSQQTTPNMKDAYLKVQHAIEFDGETYNVGGGDTMGKFQACWIDD